MRETTSMICSRISCATWGSCLRSSFRRSLGVSIESSSRGIVVSPLGERLMAPLADETRDLREEIHRAGDHISVPEGVRQQATYLRPCTLHAQQRGPRQFSLRHVLPGRLSQGRRGLLDVQEVVDDLEGQAEGVRVAAQRRELLHRRPGQQPAEDYRRGEELPGLVPVDEMELLEEGVVI